MSDASNSAEPHRFFFVHIRRTAGGALRRRLINHFGEFAVYPTRGVDGTDPVKLMLSVEHLRERLAARGDQIRVLTCHLPLCTVEQIEGSFTTMTLLRDPVERTLSSLRDDRETNPTSHSSLEQIYDAGGRFTVLRHNEMTKELSFTPAENAGMAKVLSLSPAEIARPDAPRVELGRGHLERAKERLAGVDAVGLQERFEDFCDELSTRFGWDLGEPERVNTTAAVEVSESFRARLSEDNALDIEFDIAPSGRRLARDIRGTRGWVKCERVRCSWRLAQPRQHSCSRSLVVSSPLPSMHRAATATPPTPVRRRATRIGCARTTAPSKRAMSAPPMRPRGDAQAEADLRECLHPPGRHAHRRGR